MIMAPRGVRHNALRRVAYQLASPEPARAVPRPRQSEKSWRREWSFNSPSMIDVLPARTAHFPRGSGRSEGRALSAHNNAPW